MGQPNPQYPPPPSSEEPASGTQQLPPAAGSYPPATPYGAAVPALRLGPLGNPRGIGISIVLAIVTFGIYTYVWTWKTHDEIKRHSGVGVGGPVGFLLYLVISPVTFFLLASEVGQMLGRAGRTSRVRGITGLWILLPVIGALVWFVKVQGQLNDYWRSLGANG